MLLAAGLLAFVSAVQAQQPPNCAVGGFVISPDQTIWVCAGVGNAPIQVPTGGGSSVPAGSILLVDSGACPTGFDEVPALSGRTLVGTVAANGNVGTTGGADTVTPAGSITQPTFTGSAWVAPAIAWPGSVPTHSGTAASFTGNALAGHAHELPFQLSSTTATRQIAAATFGTGTSRAATGASAAGTANTTSAAVALSQSVSAGTPSGTVTITNQGSIAWPAAVPTIGAYTPAGSVSAPTFTGTQFDNRSAFARVIFCKKT